MNNWLQSAIKWTEQRVGQASEGFKEIVSKLKTEPAMTVTDLATFIMLHPETSKKKTELLGLIFYTYTLKLENVELLLETKGSKDHKILECRVNDQYEVISHYRSYDKKVKDSLKVPMELKQGKVSENPL